VSTKAEVRAENIEENALGIQFDLLFSGQRTRAQLSLPGRHNVANALAAAAAAIELNVPLAEIAAGLAQFIAIPGRMNLSPLPCGGLLLDDSYNSNPLSASAALDVLTILPGQGRRVAVLGDMLELGEKSAKMHEDLGAKAAGVAELLLGIGKFSADIRRGAETAGMTPGHMVELADAAAAIEYLQKQQRPGDKILIKGSRGVHLEQLAEALKATATTPLNGKKGI
jgi:UDP-N-acetylmuramoyl-tripeptide--D-alanyl-D-alanine ligase